MARSHSLFSCLVLLLFACAFSYLNVEVSNVGYSYGANVTIGSTSYQTVVRNEDGPCGCPPLHPSPSSCTDPNSCSPPCLFLFLLLEFNLLSHNNL